MVSDYVYLIFHLMSFRDKYPEYAKQIQTMLVALWTDKEITDSIEAEIKTMIEENGGKN